MAAWLHGCSEVDELEPTFSIQLWSNYKSPEKLKMQQNKDSKFNVLKGKMFSYNNIHTEGKAPWRFSLRVSLSFHFCTGQLKPSERAKRPYLGHTNSKVSDSGCKTANFDCMMAKGQLRIRHPLCELGTAGG